jgi:hypothetical protein
MAIACAGVIGTAHAADVTVDPAKINLGYMNVSNLPPPAGDGAYQFGTGWGFADLNAFYTGNDLTLFPNTIGDPNVYWYQCVGGATPPNCGGPGAPGNKIMEANAYAQVDDNSLENQTVTFTGFVTSNTLTSAHVAYAFVKDFAPDFSSFIGSQIPLPASGPFSVTLNTLPGTGRHVQWGFQMVGVNVWVTDVAPFGSVTIAPSLVTPTRPTSWGSVKTLYR